MKKSLLALAVLAASGAAFAQSSVTLYGRVDLGLSKTTGGTAVMAAGSDIGTSSRIGLKGVEDLGGGLKAGFLVETGFTPDSNPASAQAWGSRNSYVDLSGGFGTVRLGRHLNPALLHSATYGGSWGTDYGYANNANILSIEGARYNNAISYIGTFAPVSVMLTTAMKENTTYNGAAAADAANIANNPIALSVNYGAGPVAAGLTLTKNGKAGTKMLTQLGASYDAKVVKASIAFEQDANQAKKNAYSLGLTAPMGAAKVQFTYGKDDSANRTQVAVGGQYDLSKRTNVYGYVAQLKTAGVAKTMTTLGLQHSF